VNDKIDKQDTRYVINRWMDRDIVDTQYYKGKSLNDGRIVYNRFD